MIVSQVIGQWYDKNKRYLPWREDKNPYYVWLSEIILQQTRVVQGLPYYEKFVNTYPSLKKLADAPLEEVLVLWQGLGYYTRARNMHKTAVIIRDQFGGRFPDRYEDIRSLPGIGEYTASAIASLAFGKPYAAIDGNVYRVLARFLGIEKPVNQSAARKEFSEAAYELLDRADPGRHNQAMIELGALLCLPKNPLCNACPLAEDCYALKFSAVSRLPVKQRKTSLIHRYFYYLVIHQGNKMVIRQRGEGDIWALLYDFPLLESDTALSAEELLQDSRWKNIFREGEILLRDISGEYKHVLSHQVLHAIFIQLEFSGKIRYEEAISVDSDTISNYPFPRLINRYLEETGG